jgi:hypothetical protein
MLARMMEGRPATLPHQLANPALEAIIRRCLRVSPADRYPSADELLADLRKLAAPSGAATIAPVADGAEGLRWWRMHQGIVTAIDIATPILAWVARSAVVPSFRIEVFLAVLALATAAVTLRSNLLFTARINPSTLAAQRRRLFLWIAGAETAIAIILLATGMAIAESRPATAAVLISLAIVMVISLAFIEPATTVAARLDRTESL